MATAQQQPQIDDNKKAVYMTVVAEKVANREAFSAYDVTKEVRGRGTPCEHWLYKDVVHQLFQAGEMQDYLRTLIQYPPGPAFLYHPPEIDANQYAASGGKSVSAVINALPSPASADEDDDDDDDVDEEELEADEDNEPDEEAEEESAHVSVAAPPSSAKVATSATGFPAPKPTIRKAGTVLYVPAPMGRHIGLTPGGDAYLSVNKQDHEILITKNPGGATAATGGVKIHVDPRANVRLSLDLLKDAGVGKMVRIGIKDNAIHISKAKAE